MSMNQDDQGLDRIFQLYRSACPDPDVSANFMPALWQRIESGRSFWFVFQRFARTAMAGCAVLTLLLLALNFVSANTTLPQPSYADALVADHSVERTYYAESVTLPPAPQDSRY